MLTFQEILQRLSRYWEEQECVIMQGHDLEMGAGTFNPTTFLRSLGPEPYRAAYIEPCRRPTDGRYGENPNRLQHYFQYQVVLKPAPHNLQELYINSLKALDLDLKQHDIRFVHDDWESPTLGAWGLGWEVWLDGMEITQFTYFQCVGGQMLKPITGELSIGIERLAMYLQNVNSIFDLQWNAHLKYGDIYHRNEVEWSHYNFEEASTEMWFAHFDAFEKEAKQLMDKGLPLPAYDFVMKASHAFNLLDARGAISVTERTQYIARIRELAKAIASNYVASREKQEFPLVERLGHWKTEIPKPPSLPEALLKPEGKKKETYLLEIGSEELPATFVPIGMRNLRSDMESLLQKSGIPFDAISVYGTPRRLAVLVEGVPLVTPEENIEKRGPSVANGFDADGNPLKPAHGFFRSQGIEPATLSAVRSGNIEGVSLREGYLYVQNVQEGQSTAKLLAEALPKLITGLDFPKKMRWADLDITYARPIRWIVSLLGKEVVPFVVGNVIAGHSSIGHRQRCPDPFAIHEAKEYLAVLKEHFVLADVGERQQTILQQLQAFEVDVGSIIEKESVMPQVVHLVEWPEVLVVEYDPQFLKVPKEVLISEMVEHQKYFPVADSEGNLRPCCVITADNTPTEKIREGNCKVLSARLSDGVFLYEKDLKVPMEQWNERLKSVTFLKGMGTVHDKVERIKKHAAWLCQTLGTADPEIVARAATLCKSDLASDMVYEFPELQGVMGRTYALAQGELAEVAVAIEEQWMPKGEQAQMPTTPAGTILSLADKVDNLLCCFGKGLKPTSSSDPNALRRQTLGIIKMIIQAKWTLPLTTLFTTCLSHFPKELQENEDLQSDLTSFFRNRIKTVFQDYGFQKDEVEASISFSFHDIYDTYLRVQALHTFRKESKEFPLLLEVYKRAKGQLSGQPSFPFSEQHLEEKAEKALHTALTDLQVPFNTALETKDYPKAYSLIAQLQSPLASLFDNVKILADEERIQQNRLALLQRVFSLFEQLLDFSKVQGL